MKHLLLCLLALTTTLTATAQLEDYTNAPNFSAMTLDSQQYDLYSVLDSGYTVIVDVMATWCPPCWSWHEGEYFKQLHDQYGPNGTNEIRVVMVEADPRTPISLLSMAANGGTAATTSLGDWTAGVDYTIINDDSFNDLYNIGYYPTIYAISPNRMVYEIGRFTDVSEYQRYAQSVPGVATADPNGLVLNYTGDVDVCEQDAVTEVIFQNHSLTNLSEVTINVMNGADVVSSNTITRDFAPYEIAKLSAGTIPAAAFDAGSLNVNISSVVMNDSNADDDMITDVVIGSPVSSSDELTLEMTTDFWSVETRLIVTGANNETILDVQYTGDAQNGGGADANKTFTYTLPVTEQDYSCWSFVVTDSYGDGCGQRSAATDPFPGLRLLDESGDELFIKNFTEQPFETRFETFGKINRNTVNSVETPAVADQVSVFPNPSTSGSYVTVELAGLTDVQEVTGQLVNALGQTVAVFNEQAVSGNNAMLTYELPTLASGNYSLVLRSKDAASTVRLSIN